MSEVIIFEVAEQGPAGPRGIPGAPGAPGLGAIAAEKNPNLLPPSPTGDTYNGFVFSASSVSPGDFETPPSQAFMGCEVGVGFSSASIAGVDPWWQVELPEAKIVADVYISVSSLGQVSDIFLEYSDDGSEWTSCRTLLPGVYKYIVAGDGAPHKFYRVRGHVAVGDSGGITVSDVRLKSVATFGVLDFGSSSVSAECYIFPVPDQTIFDLNRVFFLRGAPTEDHTDLDHQFVALDCALSQAPSDGLVHISAISRTPLTGKYHVGYV